MPETPSDDAPASRVRQAVEEGDIEVTVEDTPAGKKVGYTGADNPFDISAEQFDAFRKFLDEYEDLIVAVHDGNEAATDELGALWRVGTALADNVIGMARRPDFDCLATVIATPDRDANWYRRAACIAEVFDSPDALPANGDADAAGEACLETRDPETVVAAAERQ